jgi:TolB-like protein
LACTATPQKNHTVVNDKPNSSNPTISQDDPSARDANKQTSPKLEKSKETGKNQTDEKEGKTDGADLSATTGTTETTAETSTTNKPAETKTDITITHTTKTSSGLTAGFADDNKQFNYFLSFLDKYKDEVENITLPVSERIILHIRDKDAKSLPNAQIKVWSGNTLLSTGKSFSDGTFTFYPLIYDKTLLKGSTQPGTYKAQVIFNQITKELSFQRTGSRTVDFVFDTQRPPYKQLALDLLFIMDTTGSMGEEIERLKATIEIINLNLASLATRPALRFGMVLYKDQLDEEYVTRIIPLTNDLALFQNQLSEVTAGGGGDRPEDLQAALEAALKKIDWNSDGVRLAFIITDAPAHISTYDPAFTYKDAALAAKEKAIKLFSVGTGGLDLNGEYVLRQIAQLTQAKYIFLTRGETEESEGGKEGSVSHHTGSNFQTDKLETIIMRMAKEELNYLMEKPFTREDDYFVATKIPDETKQATLKELFDRVLNQLVDYASYKLNPSTPTVVMPVTLPDAATASQQKNPNLPLNAEYFTEEVTQALVRNPAFKAVDRKNLQTILKELELQLSGLVDEAQVAKVGQILGAKLLITGTLYQKDKNYELFLKLLNVETAEIIAVTKAQVDAQLGL